MREETKDILEYTESELNYDEIAILRRVVMQRIEKERALAEVRTNSSVSHFLILGLSSFLGS